VEYSPSTYTFKIEKCSDAQKPFNLSYDPECANDSYEKVYIVWLEAELLGEPRGTIDTTVNFEVEIGRLCEKDVISLTNLISSPLTYYLRTPSSEFYQEFNVNQIHPECPKNC